MIAKSSEENGQATDAYFTASDPQVGETVTGAELSLAFKAEIHEHV